MEKKCPNCGSHKIRLHVRGSQEAVCEVCGWMWEPEKKPETKEAVKCGS